MKVVCIIQARMGSTRLEGKIMKKVCGKTVLEHDIDRVKRIEFINEIVVATTIEKNDDIVVEEAKKLGVKYFRGSENDVLSRYYYAALENRADIIVRVTSDCPLIDPDISNSIIKYYIDNIEVYDYVSNTIERTYPRGLDTEVFSMDALQKAFIEGKLEAEREHVTPYIWKNNDLFRNHQYINVKNYSDLRLTLDTEEDLELIQEIYNTLYYVNKEFGLNDILKLFKEKPELKKINENIEQKKINI